MLSKLDGKRKKMWLHHEHFDYFGLLSNHEGIEHLALVRE